MSEISFEKIQTETLPTRLVSRPDIEGHLPVRPDRLSVNHAPHSAQIDDVQAALECEAKSPEAVRPPAMEPYGGDGKGMPRPRSCTSLRRGCSLRHSRPSRFSPFGPLGMRGAFH